MTKAPTSATKGRRPAGLNPTQSIAWSRARGYVQPEDPQRVIPLSWDRAAGQQQDADAGLTTIHVKDEPRQAGPYKWLTLHELTAIYSSTKDKRHRQEIIEAFIFVLENIREITSAVKREDEAGPFIQLTYYIDMGPGWLEATSQAMQAIANIDKDYTKRLDIGWDKVLDYVEARHGLRDLVQLEERVAQKLISHPIQRAVSRIIGIEEDYLRAAAKQRGERKVRHELVNDATRECTFRPIRTPGHLVDNTKQGQPIATAQLSLFDNYDKYKPSAFTGIKMTGANLSTLAQELLELLIDMFGSRQESKGRTGPLGDTRAVVLDQDGQEVEILIKPQEVANAPQEVPVLEVSIRQLCSRLDIRETGNNAARVRAALDELAAPRALQYVRKRHRAKEGGQAGRRAPKDEVRTIDALIKIKAVRDLETGKQRLYEISPSFIWYDQPDIHYYYMPAHGWQNEVHRLNGAKVKPSTLRLIYSLFLEFASTWRRAAMNKAKKADLIRTGRISVVQPWQTIARGMNISETSIRRNRPQVFDSLREACSVVQRVGLLHDYAISDNEEEVLLNINAGWIMRLMPDLPAAAAIETLEEGVA